LSEEFFKIRLSDVKWLYNFYTFSVSRDQKTEESDAFFEVMNWWIIREEKNAKRIKSNA